MFDKPILYINETFRTLPFTSIFFSLLIGIIFQNKLALIIAFMLMADNSINKVFKYLSKKYIKIDGERPKGAKNCGCFIDLNNVNKLATSYGMPSGHTQNIFFICTFLTLYTKSYLSKLFLLIISIYGGYLRVKFGCHTIGQVFVGGILGIIIGFISYKMLTNYGLLNSNPSEFL